MCVHKLSRCLCISDSIWLISWHTRARVRLQPARHGSSGFRKSKVGNKFTVDSIVFFVIMRPLSQQPASTRSVCSGSDRRGLGERWYGRDQAYLCIDELASRQRQCSTWNSIIILFLFIPCVRCLIAIDGYRDTRTITNNGLSHAFIHSLNTVYLTSPAFADVEWTVQSSGVRVGRDTMRNGCENVLYERARGQ